MQSFFIAVNKDGAAWSPADVDRLQLDLAASLTYASSVTHQRSFASGDLALLVYTNEPSLLLLEDDGRVLFASGVVSNLENLSALVPTAALAEQICEVPGRFSACVLDKGGRRAAAATSRVRVDPLFVGESSQRILIGTQASAIARALFGDLRYDVPGLFSLANTGFFGTNDTPFAGISCLPAGATWTADAGRARVIAQSLATHKRNHAIASEDAPDQLAADLRLAVNEMRGDEGVELGLTGGKDSRLLLAAASAAGLSLRCSTKRTGAWSDADVWVAQRLAAALGVEHRTIDAEARTSSGAIEVDYLRRAATNLLGSDGALYAYESVAWSPTLLPPAELSGLGGELLRGGYAEKHRDMSFDELTGLVRRQFGRRADLFEEDVASRTFDFLDDWLAPYRELGPFEALDSLYAEFRCGRWTAASTRSMATAARLHVPFLDNRLSATILRTPVDMRRTGRLLRALVEKLDPRALGIPLANQVWPGTTKEERRAIEARHPRAFTPRSHAGARTDWRRAFPPPLVDHIRRYVLDDGRLSLLGEGVRLDAVAAFLRGPVEELRRNFKLVHGLYSACVLVSGDWLRAPAIGEPLRLSLDE